MQEAHVENPVRTFLIAAMSMVFFSGMNVFVKLASEDYSIAQIMFFRSIMAMIPILFMMSRHGGRALMKTQKHGGHFFRGLVGIMGMILYFTSFAMLPLATASSIHFAGPLIMTALSVPLLGEKVGSHRWCAVLVGLAAVLFMINPAATAEHFTGSLVALAAAFFGAFAMLFVRSLGRTEHALTIVFYFTLYSMIAGAIGMVFMWHPLKMNSVAFLIMLGLLGGLGQITLTYAYARAPAAYVAPFSYLVMPFSVIFDVLLWRKWPDAHVWIGSLIVIGSGLYVVYREARRNQLTAITNPYDLEPVIATEADEKDAR